MKNNIVKVRQLGHAYNGHQIFKDFKFSLDQGDSVLLQGENGAGKTTILKIVSGLIAPTQGQFSFNNSTTHQGFKAVQKRLQKLTIYFHQQPFLFDTSVEKNLEYAKNSQTVIQPDEQHKLIDLLGLNNLLQENACTLSIGQKQRVALARSLIYNPAILVLDEPFTAMDKDSFSHSVDALKHYQSNNGTLLLVSHQHDRSFDLINSCWCIHPKGVLYCIAVG